MLIGELLKNKNGIIYKTQKIQLECDKCHGIQFLRLDDLMKLGRTVELLKQEYTCRNCRSKTPATLEYIGEEIISTLKRNERGILITHQPILVKCSKCNSIKTVDYSGHKFNRLNTPDKKYECIKCCNIDRIIVLGQKNKNKTYEDLYGIDKANIIKESISKKNKIIGLSTKTKKMLKKYTDFTRGKTYVEIYGIDKAKLIQDKIRTTNINMGRSRGEKNPMYGKPSPQGSGNGWSGWYKGHFFRSLLELSFIINFLEKNKYIWESAETIKYRISYIDYNGIKRNYFPDFYIKNTIIEVKPKNLLNSNMVIQKIEAAKKWCESNGLQYKIYTENDFNKLTNKEILDLYNFGTIIFTDRYLDKFKRRYKII